MKGGIWYSRPKNQSINCTHILTSSNHICHPSSISNPSHITATETYASLIINSYLSISSHYKSAHIPVPLTPSLDIENLILLNFGDGS